MKQLSPAFNRAAVTYSGFSTFAMLLFAIAIDDDRQRREKQRRRKRQAFAQPERIPAPSSAPCPF